MEQEEPTHLPWSHVAMAMGQTLPQPPQFIGSMLVSTLQPLAGLSSQLASGAPHITGDWQALLWQTPLLQSAPVLQILPSAQGPQAAPPQSISVSVPSFTPFVHEGPSQRWFVHERVSQSPACLQICPPVQGEHDPPQSTSVSSPSCTKSPQPGGNASAMSTARGGGGKLSAVQPAEHAIAIIPAKTFLAHVCVGAPASPQRVL
jgi:hypothetical protein